MTSLTEGVMRPVPEAFTPRGDRLPPAKRLLAALVLLCLIPRVWLALRMETVCDDAFYYASAAQALEQGDHARSFDYLGTNIYPLILVGLHKLGFDWFVGGTVWSVLASSLVVLPLFGSVRRLFDDRVALTACFMYAIHPRLIECGVEPIREPTFWFCLSTAMCLTLRGCRTAQLRWLAPAGVAAALAIHTRSEGWLLVLPLIAWSAARVVAHRATWRRSVVGASVWLGAIPAMSLLLGAVVTWPSADAMNSASAASSAAAGVASAVPESEAGYLLRQAGRPLKIPSFVKRAERYALHLGKTLLPGVISLMIAAVVLRRRLMLRVETLALPAMAFLILFAVWWRYAHTGGINGRYFLTVLPIMAPFDAVGMLLMLRGLGLAFERRRVPSTVPAALMLGGCLAFGWWYSMQSEHPGRSSQVALGRMLKPYVGPGDTVIADARSTRLGYVAAGRLPVFLDFYVDFDVHFADARPAVIILSEYAATPEMQPQALESAARLGLYPLDKSHLPKDVQDHIVLVRRRVVASAE